MGNYHFPYLAIPILLIIKLELVYSNNTLTLITNS